MSIKKVTPAIAEVKKKIINYLLVLLVLITSVSIIYQTVDRSNTNKKIRDSYNQMIKTNEQLERVSQEKELLLIDQRMITDYLKNKFDLQVVD